MNSTITQPVSISPAKRVLDRIVEERFTGLLRVSAHEARGEFWFLAGILEDAVFGVSRGDEAIERLLRATQVVFQAELRLPYVNGGFKKPMPASGSFAEFRPVVLMRYCESYALTCSLELISKEHTVRVTYRTGELLSVDAAGAGNEALPALFESEEGSYEFLLPPFELPEGVNADVATSASKLSLAERIDRALSDESTARAEPKALDEQATKDAKRKAEEAAAADAKRKAEEAAAAEAKRKAEAAAAAEAKRKAEAAAAEAKRKAEEAAAAEAKRKAEEAAAGEAKRKAEALEAAAAETKREAAPTKARRPKKSAAQAKKERQAKALQRRSKPSPVQSDRQVSEQPSAHRGEPEQDAITRKRGFPWFWLVLALVLGSLVYFVKDRLGAG